jgi:hypothetical protein
LGVGDVTNTDPIHTEEEETAPPHLDEVLEFFADDALFTSVARETAPHAAQH